MPLFQVIECITNGHVLEAPCNSPEEVTVLMMSCWKRQPLERMTMENLQKHLERICSTHPDYENIVL